MSSPRSIAVPGKYFQSLLRLKRSSAAAKTTSPPCMMQAELVVPVLCMPTVIMLRLLLFRLKGLKRSWGVCCPRPD